MKYRAETFAFSLTFMLFGLHRLMFYFYFFKLYIIVLVLPNIKMNPPQVLSLFGGFPVAQTVKNSPAMQETRVTSLGREDPLEEGKATHSSILAWSFSGTEEPGGLQSMGGHKESDKTELLSLHWFWQGVQSPFISSFSSVMWRLSLAPFRIISLSLDFSSLIVMCLSVVCFVFILLGTTEFLEYF